MPRMGVGQTDDRMVVVVVVVVVPLLLLLLRPEIPVGLATNARRCHSRQSRQAATRRD